MDTKLDVNTENDSIEYLEHLEPGEFCTVNIPLFNNEIITFIIGMISFITWMRTLINIGMISFISGMISFIYPK